MRVLIGRPNRRSNPECRTWMGLLYFLFLLFNFFILLKGSALAVPSGADVGNYSTIVDGTPITLRDAVLRALKIRPLRKIDKDRLKNLRSSESQARSGFYPQISTTYQNAYGNSFLGFFLFPNYQFFDSQLTTVTLNQLIFDFGKTYSQVNQRKWASKAQEDAYAQTSQALIRDVEIAFYSLFERLCFHSLLKVV